MAPNEEGERTMRSARWLALLCALYAGEGALAADADNGERLARRWCATCHVVAPDQRTITGEAPPVTAIHRINASPRLRATLT